MKIAWLACVFLLLLNIDASAQQDSINLHHKRSFGFSTGIMGLHSFVAPTFEMKTGPLNYRLRIGYYSVGAGLELEYGHVAKARINKYLKSPVIHFIVSYNASYRWSNSHWSPFVNTKPEVRYEVGNMLLWGIKAYSTKNVAVGLKMGVNSLIGERDTLDWEGLPFARQYYSAFPYGALSFYGYFFRARKD